MQPSPHRQCLPNQSQVMQRLEARNLPNEPLLTLVHHCLHLCTSACAPLGGRPPGAQIVCCEACPPYLPQPAVCARTSSTLWL